MSLKNVINAGAVKTMQIGQRYVIDDIQISEVDDSFNAGQKRTVAIVTTDGAERYYAPANVAKACKGATRDEINELRGMILEVKTYYSQRLRREIKVAEIIDPQTGEIPAV